MAWQVLVDSDRANPGWNARVITCNATLAKWLGRARVTDPIPLEIAHVASAQKGLNMTDQEEVGTVAYMTGNLTMGDRAIGMWALDHDEVQFRDGSDGGRRGMVLNHLVSKNRREAKEKPKACHCLDGCNGEPVVDSYGKVKEGPICPVELFQHYKKLQAAAAGVEESQLLGPFFGSYRRISDLLAGSTLVKADEGSSSSHLADELVLVVTRAEEERGVMYDRSRPLIVDGEEHWPRCRGVWFEVAGLGYAVRAWATCDGVTARKGTSATIVQARVGSNDDIQSVRCALSACVGCGCCSCRDQGQRDVVFEGCANVQTW